MLVKCDELGFHIADDPDDPGVRFRALVQLLAHAGRSAGAAGGG